MGITVCTPIKAIPSLRLLPLLWGLIACTNLLSQNDAILPNQQIGLPSIQNFSATDYDAHPQNYDIAQDQQGLMYFANGNGVLQYDGVNWRIIPLIKGTTAYAVGCASNGTVYVGGEGDLGYLAADSSSTLQFQSLLAKVPESFQDFTYTWQIATTEAFVYFMTDKYLLRWRTDETEKQLKAWTLKNIYHTSHVIEDEFYLWEWAKGLEKISGDSLQVVPGGDAFANSTIRIMASLEETNGKLFVGTVQKGFASYDGSKVEGIKISSTLRTIIDEGTLSNSIRLPNGNFAFATMGRGVILTDSSYQILQVLDKNTGLVDNLVTDLFIDQAGAVWASMYDGISRIEFPSPYSFFGEELGLTGHAQGVFQYADRFYVYGYAGFFELSQASLADTRTQFQARNFFNDRPAIRDVINIDGLMIAGANAGVSSFDPTADGSIGEDYALKGGDILLRSRFRSDVFYAAMGNTIGVFQKDQVDWRFLGQTAALPEVITSFVETAPSQFWATSSNSVFQISLVEDAIAPSNEEIKATPERVIPSQLSTFDESHGLPVGYVYVDILKGEAIFATTKGLRRFNSSTQRFEKELSLPYVDTTLSVGFLQVQDNGNIWLLSGSEEHSYIIHLQRNSNDQYSLQSTNFHHIYAQGLNITGIEEDPADPNIAWISTSGGLIKYNVGAKKDYEQSFPVMIRKVLVNNDSLIFGGAQAEATAPSLPFAANSMRFEYAAPTFNQSEYTYYQVYLEGFDDGWSPWTKEAKKDYTKLPEGSYTFRVKAKNVFGTLGEQGSYSFSILPPWYRTGWAYLIYFVTGLGILIGVTYAYNTWRTRRLVEQNLRLERLVAEQTEELRLSNEKLKELDQLKSQFFTNISHELRTPLTIISGMANQIRQSPSKWLEKGTTMILRNSSNLLHLINQILDLRKLERGGMQVDYIQGDIIHYLRYLLESFHSLAENKGIKVHFINSTDALLMDFDRDKIMQIFSNLISNALKFTPEQGNIYVHTEMDVAQEGESLYLHIKVEDTGIGIPPEKVPHIFDRFFQVEGSQKEASGKKSKGSGIGLSLVQELVHLLKGEIEVQSEVGKGTTFHVMLPITNEAQIADPGQVEDLVISSSLAQPKLELPKTSPNESTSLQDLEKPLLLIVEDNRDVVRYLHSLLEEHYHLLIATDGEEGIDMALSSIPDLIISDVMMPHKNGYELCNILKHNNTTSHIPIILLTSRSDEESKFTGLEQGADAYLTKPFNPDELFLRLRKLHDLRLQLLARYRSLDQPFEEDDQIPLPLGPTPLEDQFMNDLHSTVEEHLTDPDFGIPELCEAMAMGRTQLYRKIKSLTNRSIPNYITVVRLHRAKGMLLEEELDIRQAALAVGFLDEVEFSRAFEQEFGEAPQARRED